MNIYGVLRFILVAFSLSAVNVSAAPRLYWFVPDGLRADPVVFDVFGWAQSGKLPNIKRMMDEGSWGYSIPSFPSHTPTNFATLMTGMYPEKHGVVDGPMRVAGHALLRPSVSGFSSTAKKTAPIWMTLEKAGRSVALVSIPGSTPPELNAGTTVRGRWGNWGADFHAINFQSVSAANSGATLGLGARLFYQGAELTRNIPLINGRMEMLAYGATVYARISGKPDAAVSFSIGDKPELARLSRSNEWSPWLPVTLRWQGQDIETRMRICLIKLSDGYLKVRLLFDALNRTIVSPADLAASLGAAVGPMVDFPDNWPAQLNRLSEERSVLLSEAKMALDWHQRAAGHLLEVERPDVLIQDTYVPNQMLESRWWLRHIDPKAPDYAATDPEERRNRLAEIMEVYQGIDAVLGAAIKSAGPNAVIALSSDHGILAINKEVLVNNLLAREGLLAFTIDLKTGEPVIDWANSKVVFLKMIGVYINPDALAGPWTRGRGPAYEALRKRVTALLLELSDGGRPVFDRIVPWERAGELRLLEDRVPDLIFAMKPGYALTEDMDRSGDVLRTSIQSGYKQAVLPEGSPELWTPFVVMGPGVKKGFRIEKTVHNADQAPTLLNLIGVPLPSEMQGRPITEMFAR